jgi:hypothetical protein
MPFDEPKQLLDLIRLSLAGNLLKIEEFRYFGVNENVMATPDPRESKAECLRQ